LLTDRFLPILERCHDNVIILMYSYYSSIFGTRIPSSK